MNGSIGRCIIDISSTQLTPVDYPLLTHPSVAGILLFQANYQDPEQLQTLCQSIHNENPELLIFVDQEGGQIQRFKTGFTPLPSLYSLGQLYEQHPDEALLKATQTGLIMATELKKVGVDCSFAPVLDLHDPHSPIIGQKERALHSDPNIVISLAQAMIKGMHQANMVAIGKHFPGHGTVQEDSHTHSSICTQTFTQLKASMRPFIALHHQLAGIMTAHITYPAVDANHIVCHSPQWHHYLRAKLNYQGAIISDCLSMQAAQNAAVDWATNLEQTLTVCDLAIMTHMLPEHRKQLPDLLSQIPQTDCNHHANYFKLCAQRQPNTQVIEKDLATDNQETAEHLA
jgi:beta-N-acetylhexosaminidase